MTMRTAAEYLTPGPEQVLDPRLGKDFYATLLRYMGGGPEKSSSEFRGRYEKWWQHHAGKRSDWFRQDLLPRLQSRRALQGLRLLDFGCGTGSSAVVFAEAGADVVGVETHEVSIQVARQRARDLGCERNVQILQIPYLTRPGDRLDLPDESFDVVTLIGVLEHMLEPERDVCAQEIWRVLKPGGELFIFDTPNRLHPFDHHTTHLWGVGWMPVALARRWAVRRGRFAANADFARRGGTGISRRRIDRLFPAKDWLPGYEKKAPEIANEFGWAAPRVAGLGTRRPEVAKRWLQRFGRALIRLAGWCGRRPQEWTVSHTMSLTKR